MLMLGLLSVLSNCQNVHNWEKGKCEYWKLVWEKKNRYNVKYFLRTKYKGECHYLWYCKTGNHNNQRWSCIQVTFFLISLILVILWIVMNSENINMKFAQNYQKQIKCSVKILVELTFCILSSKRIKHDTSNSQKNQSKKDGNSCYYPLPLIVRISSFL